MPPGALALPERGRLAREGGRHLQGVLAEAKRQDTEVGLDVRGEDPMDRRQGRGEVTREGPHGTGKGRRAHSITRKFIPIQSLVARG